MNAHTAHAQIDDARLRSRGGRPIYSNGESFCRAVKTKDDGVVVDNKIVSRFPRFYGHIQGNKSDGYRSNRAHK